MSVKAIDHLYLETRSFDETVRFWEGLGFRLAARWGQDGHRAGRLASGRASIVLAESDEPVLTVHFGIDDADRYAGRVADGGDVPLDAPLSATHWGTRLMRVRDPDGRVFALEETGQAG
jgi:catechol 2,3-dioxygenase-like lactoylglutathione lyase family enzyme